MSLKGFQKAAIRVGSYVEAANSETATEIADSPFHVDSSNPQAEIQCWRAYERRRLHRFRASIQRAREGNQEAS